MNSKILMDCAQATRSLTDYLDGHLPESTRGAVEAHVKTCSACRVAFDRLADLDSMVGGRLGKNAFSPMFSEVTDLKLGNAHSKTRHQNHDEESEFESTEDLKPEESFVDRLRSNFGVMPWWCISGTFHCLLLLLVTLIGMALIQETQDEVIIVAELEKKIEPEEIKEQVKREIFTKVETQIEEVETEVENIVTHEEVEVSEMIETDNDSDVSDTFGEDGISDTFLGGSGTVAAVGLGGGGGGAFGRPNGKGGRLRRAVKGGGGKKTESAVDKALEWLAKNQKADGSWGNALNENAKRARTGQVGITGLALLAFLGAGHTEKIGRYQENVRKAVAWIISIQKPNGALGAPIRKIDDVFKYGHAIAGMALVEASAMGRVPGTRKAAQRVVDCTTKMQGGGESEKTCWNYGKTPDMSINGWFIMQLKSAKVAGLQVNPSSFEGAMKFLDSRQAGKVAQRARAEDYDDGGHRYGYRSKKFMMNCTAIGNLCRLFMGTHPDKVRGAVAWMAKENPPSWNPKIGRGFIGTWPMYYMYYNTLSSFQVGGEVWKNWNTQLKTTLLGHQRKDGVYDGSWDPLGSAEKGTGRVYSTALGALCLEVYYRYLPMYQK